MEIGVEDVDVGGGGVVECHRRNLQRFALGGGRIQLLDFEAAGAAGWRYWFFGGVEVGVGRTPRLPHPLRRLPNRRYRPHLLLFKLRRVY